MVPRCSGIVMLTTNITTASQGLANITQTASTSSCTGGQSSVSGLDGFRQTILAEVSEQTAQLLSTHSCRKSTTAAYSSAWPERCSWCPERQIDPVCSTVAAVADYLTSMFDKGRCYRTINNHRSAISAYHHPVDGQKVGQHDLVCQVLKACFNGRPPQPKYATMWDVDVVLTYMGALGCNSNLLDKQLTFKVTMLLALASAGRSSELRAFNLRYTVMTDSTVVFELG